MGRRSRSRSRSSSPEAKKHKKDKKEHKKKSKKEKKEKEKKEIVGYTNEENPYGDNSILEKFDWKKKREKEQKSGLDDASAKKKDQLRREETMIELEKLKKRRAEREIEMQLHDQEMNRQQRLREMEMYGDLDAKEDEFHLEQAKIRAQIRIKNGRAKPIDILAMSMNLDNEAEISIEEPYKIFNGLNLEEVEELKKDIQLYLELEMESNLEFWQSMMIVCEDQIEKQRIKAFLNQRGESQINSELEKILANKNVEQLAILKKTVLEKLKNESNIDIEYWENLLKGITVYTAMAKLRTIHEETLAKRLEQLRNKQKIEAENAQKEMSLSLRGREKEREERRKEKEKEKERDIQEDIERGYLSPSCQHEKPDAQVLDPEEDWKQLQRKRLMVKENRLIFSTIKVNEPSQHALAELDPEEAIPRKFAEMDGERYSDDEDIEEFNIEIPLEKQIYLWQDKYRPRKPKYFNRVHTGYEWNKYNQTHYDTDNPPPKVVQGYRFNIFYPHLINKSDTPTYKIVKDPSSPDDSTRIIKFTAGPPYEDIAFKIINKEWEHSHKRSFRCTFDKGVLSLHFRFKKYKYRR